MRLVSFAALSFLALAACGDRQETPQSQETPQAEPKTVLPTDDLSGFTSPATGLAFWVHPNVSFNSLLIVAGEAGVASYNIENGDEVSRAAGRNLRGAEVSYFGFGPQAAGFAAAYDTEENAMAFFGIDNNTRAFSPLLADETFVGAMRAFCMGRASSSASPSLFIIQREKIRVLNLESRLDGIGVESEANIPAPDDLIDCAVDQNGVLIVLDEDGDVFRLDSAQSFNAPFAVTGVRNGRLEIAAKKASTDDPDTDTGHMVVLDPVNGQLHLFALADGHAQGSLFVAATDEIEAVEAASVVTVTGGNLGAVYRNGAIALGVEGETSSSVRIVPFNGAINALTIESGEPANPRGEIAEPEDNGISIPPTFEPGN